MALKQLDENSVPLVGTSHSGYRPDIDGLRAIAIIPVLLYHVGMRGFSGGFVGVDVFFVISGYLITGILIRDLEGARFSILEFYRRRAIRILPALFCMAAVVTIISVFVLLPSELPQYAVSLAGAALFVSNIEFYRVTDYFDLGASARPLLHTWSLAVEEQWYIFWPLVLAAIGPKRRGVMIGLAILLTLSSLAFSMWLISVDSAATFYLLPPRAWELGIGALLAMTKFSISRRPINELVALVGLGSILFAVKFYTHLTQFPGLAAVLPCAGAAALILAGREANLVARVLSIGPLRFVGWISYSLYLWHWPVIVFVGIGLFWPQSGGTMAFEIVVSFLLATLSWYLVERSSRLGVAQWSTKKVLSCGAMAIGAAVGIAIVSPLIAPDLTNFTDHQKKLSEYVYFDGDAAYRRDICFQVGPRSKFDEGRCLAVGSHKPDILLLGDSHSAQLWPGFSKHSDNFDVLQATVTNCVAKLYPVNSVGYCEKFNNHILRDWLPEHPVSALLIASRWQQDNIGGLEETLLDPTVRAAHPVLVGPVPQYMSDLPRLLVFSEKFADPSLIARSQESGVFPLDERMRAIAAKTSTPYISLVDLLCRNKVCRTLASDSVPMQFDYGHLTPEGSDVVVNGMMPQILALLGKSQK